MDYWTDIISVFHSRDYEPGCASCEESINIIDPDELVATYTVCALDMKRTPLDNATVNECFCNMFG